MRIPALAILAFIANGCSIHVVEEPSTPVAQRSAPVPVAARTPPHWTATAPSQSAPPPNAGRALPQPSASAAQVPPTAVRTRPRPELVTQAQPARRLRFKDTTPQPRTTELAGVQASSGNVQRVEKHRHLDQKHASLASVAQAQ